MKKKSKIFILSVFLTVVVASCFYSFYSKKQDSELEKDELQLSAVSSTETLSVNPLTGLFLEESKVNNRPVAIMINNLHSGQPLLGVYDADILYECPTEGGITRILGVFKDPSAVPAIGSVRSSRPYFISIAKGLDAIYFHLGGSTHAYQILKSGYIDSIDLIKGKFMWRDQTRLKKLGLEHSALTSGEKILQGINDNKFRTKLADNYIYSQKFGENSQVLSGSNANTITATFSGYKYTTFSYDEQNQTYLISQFKGPQMDDNIKKQNSKPNVIFIDVFAQNIDNTELLKLDITGSGSGKYFSKGKFIDINWVRKNDNSPFEFFTANNDPLVMIPGKSYVCLLAQWAHVKID